MSKKFYIGNSFERSLRDTTEEFKMYPSKRVWHSIYNNLHPGQKWPSMSISMVLFLVILTIGNLNTRDNTINKNYLVQKAQRNSLNLATIQKPYITNNTGSSEKKANTQQAAFTHFEQFSSNSKIKSTRKNKSDHKNISSEENFYATGKNINTDFYAKAHNKSVIFTSYFANNTYKKRNYHIQRETVINYLRTNQNQSKWLIDVYFAPNISYRSFNNNQASASFINNINLLNIPSLGLEAGVGLLYDYTRNLRFSAGVQVNYSSYGITSNTHSVNQPAFNNSSALFSASNTPSLSDEQSVNTYDKYQFSLPLGVAYKLAGNNNIEWYAGATIQPSLVFGSSRFSNSPANDDNAANELRKWNVNTGVETYINYKIEGINLHVGPQFRYQLRSTYKRDFSIDEKLYNIGIKLGVMKAF